MRGPEWTADSLDSRPDKCRRACSGLAVGLQHLSASAWTHTAPPSTPTPPPLHGVPPLQEHRCHEDAAEKSQDSKKIRRKSGTDKNELLILEQFQMLSKTLDSVFSISCHVASVVFLFGGTIFSPKEQYMLQLPCGMYEGDILSFQKAKAALFKNLLSSNFFGSLKQLAATKLHMLINADRNSDLGGLGLKPKPNFKISQRVENFVINIVCKCTEMCCELSQLEEPDLEISGVEALERSLVNTAEVMQSETRNNSAKNDNTAAGLTSDAQVDSDGFLWYQLPFEICGCK